MWWLVGMGEVDASAREPRPPMVEVVLRAARLDEILVGTWCIYPLDEPALGEAAERVARLPPDAAATEVEGCTMPKRVEDRFVSARSSPPADGLPGAGLPKLTFHRDGRLVGHRPGEVKPMNGTYQVDNTRGANTLRVSAVTSTGRGFEAVDLLFVNRNLVIVTQEGQEEQLGLGRARD